MSDEAGTQFKDIYDIVVGIGEVWNDISDIDQAALLNKLAGKLQGNALAAALNNIDTIKEVYETAEFESSGSAQRENEKYLDSIEGRVANLKTAFQELSSVTLDSGVVKGLISGFTQVLDIITTVIDKIGVIPTIISGIGIGAFIKNFAQKIFLFLNWAKSNQGTNVLVLATRFVGIVVLYESVTQRSIGGSQSALLEQQVSQKPKRNR